MSATALITGRIFRAPLRRECKNGQTMALATVKVIVVGAPQWWQVVAFSASGDELLELDDGDAVSIMGRLELELYKASTGESKIARKIVVEKIIVLAMPRSGPKAAPVPEHANAAPSRRRAPAKRKVERKETTRARPTIDDDLNDSVPW